MTKFASQIEIVYMPVENDKGKFYQKPYMRITDFDNEQVYIQLRDDLNIPEFSRILISALDYNTISVAAKFAFVDEKQEQNKEENSSISKSKQVLNEAVFDKQKSVEK